MNESCRASTRTVSLMKKCDAADVTDMHTHTHTHTCRPNRHTVTQSEISQNPNMQTWLTLRNMQSGSNTHTHISGVWINCTAEASVQHSFFMCVVWLVVTVLETLLLSTTQRSAHITIYQCEIVCICMCGRWDTCVVCGGRLAGA